MNIAISTRTYTPEDLLTMPEARDHRYELEDGHLLEREMSILSSWVAHTTGRVLGNYCAAKRNGWVLESEATYQCFPNRPGRIRRPDVSFIKTGRVSRDEFQHGHIRVAPDLLVEVISPNDVYYDVERRVDQYQEAGVPLIWLVNPDRQTVLVRRQGGSVSELSGDDELTGEDVVPGFHCKVRDLFPPLELLATLNETAQE